MPPLTLLHNCVWGKRKGIYRRRRHQSLYEQHDRESHQHIYGKKKRRWRNMWTFLFHWNFFEHLWCHKYKALSVCNSLHNTYRIRKELRIILWRLLLYLGAKLGTWKILTRTKLEPYPNKTESRNLDTLGSCSDFLGWQPCCLFFCRAVHFSINLDLPEWLDQK